VSKEISGMEKESIEKGLAGGVSGCDDKEKIEIDIKIEVLRRFWG
jgi:hypothetical protein